MKKLTRDERCEISALHKAGKTPSQIAKQLRRSISKITRELYRNSTDGKYNIITANEVATERRGRHNNQKITPDNWTYIRTLWIKSVSLALLLFEPKKRVFSLIYSVSGRLEHYERSFLSFCTSFRGFGAHLSC